MAHGNSMANIRFNAVGIALAVAILGGCSFAQDQDANDPNVELDRLCSFDRLSTPYDVGTSFSVRLLFHHAPVVGIRVVLTPTGESPYASGHIRVPVIAVTDSSGVAHFFAVPKGRYTAGAKDGLFFPSNEVTVHAKGDSDKEISIRWPLDPLPVRTLRGKLIAAGEDTDPDRPLVDTTVELVDLRSSRVIETQPTLADGSYEFSATEPGLYVIRVTPPAKDRKKTESGDLAIELDPAAHESTIPEMKVTQSDCVGVQFLRKTGEGRWELQDSP
jgi:hypothetical protein